VNVQPTMTPGRIAWLEKLSQGPAKRGRSVVGYQVMQLGWTEWHYVDRATGMPISEDEARENNGARGWDCVRNDGERLTQLGWTVLRQHRERMAKLSSARAEDGRK